ncbi:serine/threonine-protein kinase [Nocardia higoensis]|uniref:serine/threonine-protein kinase n=1 Tax=Nocardia higoensis TaxID=228599 RepID=UPI002B4B4AE0|nr:protein kinase [Nocardia higoensis]
MRITVLQIGETFAGYEIKRVLGKGGMGTVYLARHPRLPRLTALKLLARELYTDAEIRGRFEREADLVAQLDHPNIVTVYDRGAEDDQLWISMQFISGSDAAAVDVDVLAPARAVQIIAEVGAALDFAHANGVLHRDIKPANILLAKAPIGHPERVLLTDFGIAGVRDSDTTLASGDTITATLAYAAPEQLGGRPLDHRADQYSLGCTLYWLLTGSAPFPDGNPAKVIHDHLYSPPPSVRATRPALPPRLDAVLAKAMAKNPADRFDSCTEFAVAARQALTAGRAPTAPPQPYAPHAGPTGYPPGPAQPNHGYRPTGYSAAPSAAPNGPYPTAPYPGNPHPAGNPYPTAHGPSPAGPRTGTNPPYPVSGPRPGANPPFPASNPPFPASNPANPSYPATYGPYPTPGARRLPAGYPNRPGTGRASPPFGPPPASGAGRAVTGSPASNPQSHPGYPNAGGAQGQSSQPGSHQTAPGLPPTTPFPASPGAVDLARPYHQGASGPVPPRPPTGPPHPAQPPAAGSPAADRPASGPPGRASGRTPRPIVIALPDRVRRGRPAPAGNGGASGAADGEGRPPP